MKIKYLLTFAILMLLKMQSYGQTYISQKQSYYIDGKEVFFQGEKKIILGDTLIVEIPNHPTLYGNITFDESSLKDGYKTYKIKGGGLILIFKDQIIANLFDTKYKIAITYFLPINEKGVLVTLQERKNIADKEYNKIEEELHNQYIKLYGELTADCIKDRKLRIGMKDAAIMFVLLKRAININTTETATGIHKQFVYDKMYIYSENGIVTAIQTEE
ncbi:MAG: hypothetical protein M0R37_02840 [Bacteroidales bacterium]|nr:hypothetical protein [Bacteroidales bacterium]